MRKEMQEMMRLHTSVETFMYQLIDWKQNNMDNENISDGLYGFVTDMIIELRREYSDIEQGIFEM